MPALSRRTWLLLMGILLGNLLLQSRSFFSPHVTGDQRLYVGLAMKLDEQGFAGYNLRQIGVRAGEGTVEFYRSTSAPGDLLGALTEWGTPFYDQPMFHTPPVFPALIAASHQVFAPGQPFAVAGKQPGAPRFGAQFYACAVPVGCSALLVGTTFFLGRKLFSDEVGLGAAFLLALTPIQILSGQRIWADATLAALVCGAMLLLVLAGGRMMYAVAAAVCVALALMTKITAMLILPAVLYAVWICRMRLPKVAIVAGIVLVMTLPWYVAVWRTFGMPFFAPSQPGISRSHEWFALINSQPWYTYLVGIPCQVPVAIVGYLGLARLRSDGEKMLAVWFVVWLVGLTWITSTDEMLGPEQRYLLPAYPALAILSAHWLTRNRWGVVALVLSAAWSVWIWWQARGFDEISFPF